MSGKEAIIEKILSDTRANVNSTLEEANIFSAEEISVAQNDVKVYREKNMAESYLEREEIIRRKITVANLEVKKLVLQAKQELIGVAFESAVEAVKKDTTSYQKLVERMISIANDGDIVIFSQLDKALFDEKWLKTHTDKNVKISEDYGTFCGGVILKGKGSDKNMTLEVELDSVRNNHEPEIAAILFGE